MARLTIFCAVAACVFASVAAAGIYPGKSQALMPAPKEVGFTNMLAFQPAKKPKAALSRGYKNGVVGIFQKGTTTAPTETVITAYVYTSSANALLAWKNACTKCKVVSAPAGLKLKAEAGTSNGQPTLHEITVCANVYVDVVEQGKVKTLTLDTDVAKSTNAVYQRAVHGGLSSCSAK